MPTYDEQGSVAESKPLTELPETELSTLLEQVANKNLQAFHELFQRTSDTVFAILLRMMKDPSTAEHALQETYARIWNNTEPYRYEFGAPLTWIIAIARNRALTVLRKGRIRENLVPIYFPNTGFDSDWAKESHLHEHSHQPTPWQTETQKLLNNDASAQTLLTDLDKLNENQLCCIIEAYCEGFSHEELSVQTGAPVSAVKSSIRKGLQILRECAHERT